MSDIPESHADAPPVTARADSTATSPSPAAAAAVSPADPDIAGSRVLIVDDNAQNVELLQAYLESLPVEVDTAEDGVEAIDRIEDPGQPAPDLVLLDVMMPRMSGFEVCRKLKDDPHTRDIPVMMVTALNELGDIERGVESGTDEFLSKPVNKLELITRVKSLLQMRRLRQNARDQTDRIRDLEGRLGA
jgi:two-component system cell cycle response regulator